MLEEAHSLPDDIAALKAMVLSSRAEVAARDAELRNRDLLIEKLKHQLAGLRRQRFGATSEALDQLELGLEDEEIARSAEAVAAPAPASKRQPKRRPLPDHLPREETHLAPPGDRCTDCGGRLKRLGEDVTEELEYIPGRFVVKRIVRPRLACSGCETFHQAPLPSRPIERGRPGPGLLAHVLVSKYCDHLPLYRQSRIFARDGVDLDRSTLAGWVGKATALLEPLADAVGRPCSGRPSPVRRRHPGQASGARDRQDGDGSGPGPMSGTSVRGRARHRRRRGTASRPTARRRIRRAISRATPAGCTRTAMPASAHWRARGRSARSPAWRMCGASSSTSMPLRVRRSPPRRWNGSPRSTPSRRRPAGSRPSAASQSAAPGPRRTSMSSSAGCKRNCRGSPPRPRWRRRSAMH